jgi:Asp/Glu/hydantoin racemase
MFPIMSYRIALVHAGLVSIEPVQSAFSELWPDAQLVNLLDDSLMVDRAKGEHLTLALSGRIAELAAYGQAIGADGILYTCSAFGPAIEAVQRSSTIPVLKPNEAMFEAALGRGLDIGMVASFANSIPTMEQEFHDLAFARGSKAAIRSVCVPEALAALQRGDIPTHNALLAKGAMELGKCDVILLAQFSTSRAADATQAMVNIPVLNAPGAAVKKIRHLLHG